MTEHQTRRVYESALPTTFVANRSKSERVPALEDITPATYARMSAKQRKELLNRLVEYLKSI